MCEVVVFFFFQAEDGIRDIGVTGVQTCALPIYALHPVLSQAGTEAATRFEQTSGPVMAKGVEDSAYYRWTRFVALNEVGGDPARFGSTVEEFHEAQQRRLERKPASMTTLSTHDTKRSEDVRARLAVLGEQIGRAHV